MSVELYPKVTWPNCGLKMEPGECAVCGTEVEDTKEAHEND